VAGGLAASPLAAQQASIFMGGVHARYADSVTGTAGLLAARIGHTGRRFATLFDANFSRFATGEAAVQVAGQGVLTWPLSRAASIGILGLGTVSTFDGGNQSAILAGGPVLLVGFSQVGGSLRVGGGGVRRVDGSELSLLTGQARLDTKVTGNITLTTQAAATRAGALRFADFGGGLAWERPAFRVEAGIGARVGDLPDNPEWRVRVEVRPTGGTVLEAAAGAYPRDVSGFTSGGFASVGLRVAVPGRVPAVMRRAVAVQRLGQAKVKVSIAVPGARDVAIAGEWNAWTPAALQRDAAGRWSVELALAPGVYRFALLVNGDRWTVPDEIAAVPDEFGGKAALLVIP
jgi:hypothetical protein